DNTRTTPPTLIVPTTEDRPRGEQVKKEIVAARQRVEERKKAAVADFGKWLGGAGKAEIARQVPTESLYLHAALSEGAGNAVQVKAGDTVQTVVLPEAPSWDAGHVAAKAYRSKVRDVLELPGVGDFEKDRAFSYGAWVKIADTRGSGAIFARMDEGDQHRGWDLWVEGGRVGTHIIHRWPEDAVKVVTNTPLMP